MEKLGYPKITVDGTFLKSYEAYSPNIFGDPNEEQYVETLCFDSRGN